MEPIELIKAISEFGLLIVIAGLYLYERFMSDKDSAHTLREVKALLGDLKEKTGDSAPRNLSTYDFHSMIDLYLSAQKCDLIMECDSILTINHIHDDEEATREKVVNMVKRVHTRNTDFIDTLSYKNKNVYELIDSREFVEKKAEICTEWILSENHNFLTLYRSLDAYFENFKNELE